MAVNKNVYQVHNYMEDIVSTIIKNHVITRGLCKCQRCLLDISAIVLNHIPPQYIQKEAAQSRLNPATIADILAKVEKAALLVEKTPNHDPNLDQEAKLNNLSEPLVFKIIDEVVETNQNNLDEERLVLVAIHTLNQVKPRYAVTHKGGAYQRLVELEPQYLPAIMSVVCNVIKQLERELG